MMTPASPVPPASGGCCGRWVTGRRGCWTGDWLPGWRRALSTTVPEPRPCAAPQAASFHGSCDIQALRDLQARGATLLDSREPRRYAGLEEPIDPVAGHIPGALNRCWQEVTDAEGRLRPEPALRAHFGELLEARPLVVYCGSGVTACVNLYALARLGRDDALLYPGSWSDWCSYL